MQARIKQERARFNVLDWGRRTGKTTFQVDVLTEPDALLAPCAYFAPTYKMLTDVWRTINQVVQPIIARRDVQQHRLEYITGGTLDMWSLDDPNAARGRKYRRVCIDEAAMIRHLEEAWNAVIRPTLVDLHGDAYIGSTPKGLNFFHTLYQWGQDTQRDDWRSWMVPTSANPFIPPAEIEALKEALPERTYLQEIEAQFLTNAGAVFRNVHEAMTATPQQRAIDGHQYVMGIDWAREQDFTVICVIDSTTGEQVALDRFNKVEYTLQKSRVQAMYERFPKARILAEENSIGNPLISDLRRAKLPIHPFVTTNASKADAVDALSLALERGKIRLLNDPVQLGELLAYEGTKLPSGLIRYSAPDGMHDDTVMALMIAWQHAARPGVSVEWL